MLSTPSRSERRAAPRVIGMPLLQLTASKMVTRWRMMWKFLTGKAAQISNRRYPSFEVEVISLKPRFLSLNGDHLDTFTYLYPSFRIWFTIFCHFKMLTKANMKTLYVGWKVGKKWSKWINWAASLAENLLPPFHTGWFIGIAHEWIIYFHFKVILRKLNAGLNIKISWITEERSLHIVTNSLRKKLEDYLHHSKKIEYPWSLDWNPAQTRWSNRNMSTKLIKVQWCKKFPEREHVYPMEWWLQIRRTRWAWKFISCCWWWSLDCSDINVPFGWHDIF